MYGNELVVFSCGVHLFVLYVLLFRGRLLCAVCDLLACYNTECFFELFFFEQIPDTKHDPMFCKTKKLFFAFK